MGAKVRPQSASFHAALSRWLCLVLHRRAGKTTAVINHHQRAALDDSWERTRLRHLKPDVTDANLTELLRGRYYAHILPTYRQAKLTTWDMAKYFAAPIPGVTFNEAELRIDYPNGSKLQLFGSDKPDRLRGLAFSGVSARTSPTGSAGWRSPACRSTSTGCTRRTCSLRWCRRRWLTWLRHLRRHHQGPEPALPDIRGPEK